MIDTVDSIKLDIKSLFQSHGWLFLLFLVVQFTSLFSYHIYLKVVFSILVLFGLGIRSKKDLCFYLIVLFCFLYVTIVLLNHVTTTFSELVGLLFAPAAYYLLGQSIVSKRKRDSEISSFLLLIVLSTCSYLYVSSIIDIRATGLINPLRDLSEGTGESFGAATLLGVLASIGFAGVSYNICNHRIISSLKSVLFLACSLLSLITVIHLLNRTGLVVLAVTVIIVSLYAQEFKIRKIIPALFCLIVIFAILYYLGYFQNEIVDAYIQRGSEEGNLETANGRFDRWWAACHYMFEYPFGWSTEPFAKYCHSLWFDTARVAGLVPFTVLVIITVCVFRSFIKMIRIKRNTSIGLFLGFNVCMLLSASMEPILEGASTYFCLLALLWGMQNRYIQSIQ